MTHPGRQHEHSPVEVLRRCRAEGRPAHIAGPMVRYSKLPFRATVRHYGVDLVYSPMILAREFVRNEYARLSDFSTNPSDTPLIVQVGVNNCLDLLRFVEMIRPYCDGIGINCGCPIKEQVREGIGAALMGEPDLVARMVRAVKDRYGDAVVVETKIRIHSDLTDTIDFVQKVQDAGVDFITVHGRTKTTRSSVPVNLDAIKTLRQYITVPMVANGDCFSLQDCARIAHETHCDGVMAVRGILANPALFTGQPRASWDCVERFMHYAISYGLPFRLIQHHLSCMLDSQIPKKLYLELMAVKNTAMLLDYLDDRFVLRRPGDDGFAQHAAICYRPV